MIDQEGGFRATANTVAFAVSRLVLAKGTGLAGRFGSKRLAEVLGPDRAGSVVYQTEEVKDGMEIDLSMLDVETGLLFPGDRFLCTGFLPSKVVFAAG